MTTTPETPSEGLPDKSVPAAERPTAGESAAVPTTEPTVAAELPAAPAAATPHRQDGPTIPVPPPPAGVDATQPIPAPAPGQPYSGQPYGDRAPSGQPYPGQPYGGQPYPGQPHTGQPHTGPSHAALPSAGQPQPGQPQPGQPYAGQPYAGQPYVGQQHAGEQHAGEPYAGEPYPGQPYPGQPAAAAPGAVVAPVGAPTRRRRWLPVLATLLVVLLLAVAAVAVASRGLGGSDTATGSQPGSLATIGQESNDSVPVAGSTSENPDWPAVVEAVQSSVVSIEVTTSSGTSLGSGVIIDSVGYVLTNDHVVSGATEVKVTLDDGRLFDATIVGTDATTDLAVVAITDAPDDLVVSELGDSSEVTVGESVMAVGNPLGLANTVTTGIVSAVDRPVSTSTEDGESVVTNAIQIDAAINPGNSGGPLFNAQGQVIGITSSIATTSSDSGSIGIGFAIPSNLVESIASQLIESGTAQHAYLGVSLTDGTATADGVTRRGAQVEAVSDESPAADAGLEVGDVIVAIDGESVGGAESLTAYVRSMTSGQETVLTVVRDGTAIDITATLATSTQTTTPTPNSDGSDDGSGTLPDDLENMTPEELWQWLQEQQGGSGQGGSGSDPGQG